MNNRKALTSALVTAAFLMLSISAIAATEKMQTMTGQIKKIDAPAKTVTVYGKVVNKEQELIFHLSPRVSITRNNQKVMLQDLKVGDRVTIQYAGAKKTLTAHTITLQGAEPLSGQPKGR